MFHKIFSAILVKVLTFCNLFSIHEILRAPILLASASRIVADLHMRMVIRRRCFTVSPCRQPDSMKLRCCRRPAGGKQVPCCGARHLPAVTKHLGICRPLPLARVVYPATGSTPLAPHRTAAFNGFESGGIKKRDTPMGYPFSWCRQPDSNRYAFYGEGF